MVGVSPLLFTAASIVILLTADCAEAEEARVAPTPKLSAPVSYDDLLGIVDVGVNDEYGREGIAVSPDGRFIAVETRRQDLRLNRVVIRWNVVPLQADAAPVDVGDGGEPILFTYNGLNVGNGPPEKAIWSSDSQWIVYRAQRGGQIQLWRSSRDGAIHEQLTHNSADIERFCWSSDGRLILFQVGRPRMDTAKAEEDEGRRGYLYDTRFAPLHSLKPLRADQRDHPAVWVYEPGTKDERLATPSEESAFAVAGVSRVPWRPFARLVYRTKRSAALAWTEDLRAGGPRGVKAPVTVMASRDGSKGTTVACRALACTGRFKSVWMSDDGKLVTFLRWEGPHEYGSMVIYDWKVGSRNVRRILKTDGLLKGCGYRGIQLICGYESATHPCSVVTVDLSHGAVTTIYDPNRYLKQRIFGEVTQLQWRDRNGVEGFGHLVKPVGYVAGKRYPLVVVQYRSRGFLRGGIGDEFPIHVLASKGFAVLSFDHPDEWEMEERLNSYDEIEREGWVGLHGRRRVFSVLMAGIDLLCDGGFVDCSKVGITGLSGGGEIVAFALIHAPTRFAAAAAAWTAWNPSSYYLAGPNLLPMYQKFGFDDPLLEGSAARWNEVSIATNAARIRTPLLLQVSDSELVGETETVTEMQRHDDPIELYVFPNEFHIKSQPSHRYYIYRRSVQWFRFWLQGVEDPTPVDPQQYQRWRRLLQLAADKLSVTAPAR
jgi:poly(3-hydroxybutyrate) depolymerase